MIKRIILAIALLSSAPLHASQAFNGSSQSASVSLDLSSNSVISVCAWVYVNALIGTDQNFWELTGDSLITAGGVGCIWEAHPYVTLFVGGTGGGFGSCQACNYTPPSTGAWHHYVATYDRSLGPSRELDLWIDGVLQTPVVTFINSSTGNYANSTFHVGARTNSTNWLAGKIAGLTIYNESLSAADIKSLAAGLHPMKVRPSKIIRLWMFDNGLIDLRSSAALTNNGSTQASDGPRIYR